MLLATTNPASAQLYVASYFTSALYNYSPTGGGLQSNPFPPGSLEGPSRITLGPDGNIYIANQGPPVFSPPGTPPAPGVPGNVLRYNPTTGVSSTFLSSADLTLVGGASYSPTGLSFGADGNFYLARNNGPTGAAGSGAIDRFSPTGAFLGTVATGFTQPVEITIRGTDLYVSNLRGSTVGGNSGLGSVDRIANYTTATSATAVVTNFVAAGSGGLENPTGTAFDSQGRFYIADVSDVSSGASNKVNRYNADGSFETTFIGPAVLGGTFTSDIIFTDDGDALVAGLGFPGFIPGTVSRFSDVGAFETSILVDTGISPSSLVLLPVPEPLLLVALGGIVLLALRKPLSVATI